MNLGPQECLCQIGSGVFQDGSFQSGNLNFKTHFLSLTRPNCSHEQTTAILVRLQS
jgi:hypothetical protein